MSKWPYKQGLHEIGNGIYAYLQPDGSWGLNNAGDSSPANRVELFGIMAKLV